MEVGSLLLKIQYASDQQEFNATINRLNKINKLLNDLQKKANLNLSVKSGINPPSIQQSNSGSFSSLPLRHFNVISTISKTLLKMVPYLSAFTGAVSIASAVKLNNVTAGVLDELNWQNARSATAFRYMNVAARSNLVNENAVAQEIQAIMKQQREFKTTGVASDVKMQAMFAQFGLSLGDNIEKILTTLDSRRKVMGSSEYYTYMQQIGLNNIARAQIESSKYGAVPQLYTMNRAEKTADLSRNFNKFTANLKNDGYQILESAIPLINNFMDAIVKLCDKITPPITKFINIVNEVSDSGIVEEAYKQTDKVAGGKTINTLSITDIPDAISDLIGFLKGTFSTPQHNNSITTNNNQKIYNQQRNITINNNNRQNISYSGLNVT